MFSVEGYEIKLTRGDSAELSVILYDDAGEAYALQDGDKLEFSVKRTPLDSKTLFVIESNRTGIIEFKPQTTKKFAFGKYKYDIQLTTANGNVFTVTPVSDFVLLEEITE